MSLKKICVVGSGNWGTVIAKIVGTNVLDHTDEFEERVTMYVYEEIIDGVKLTDIINFKHENVKYLPGIRLPNNVVAIPTISEACADCDILIFVIPHQFMAGICKQMVDKTKPSAVGVSLIKGLDATSGKLDLISNIIRRMLKIECAVLMGANVANDVAQENYCEATIGCKNKETGRMLKDIFQSPYFRITVVPDEEAVEVCGALKNIVALGAGFVDGLRYGDNTKAALMRLGFMEMIEFCRRFFPGSKIETFLQSCGIADLVTTCYSGRNRKVAEAYAAGKGKSLEELEVEMLNGQKLQGPPTAAEVFEVIKKKNQEEGKDWIQRFPIMTTVHRISIGELPPKAILECMMNHPEHE